ncbi:MAG: transglutaminase-like domain-containing protein, partial [Bacteroidetes bacterium]|nr:transglutaminase-like domain-containing protein [Bacteroidota bacterium]
MKKILFLLFVCSLITGFNSAGNAQIIKDSAFDSGLEPMLKIQSELAGSKFGELSSVFGETKNADELQAVKFLLAYLPLSDIADYSGKYFLDNVRMSLKAREETPWGKNIPGDVFYHFVLPVRVNNENLDDFRTNMYDEIIDRVKGMSMKDAALEINHWCHEKVTYKPSDERTSAPLSTMRTTYGRCGEESTFFVAALRTAGIPARQVYTPRWAHTDDNHAWVEIWVDGKWYFLGACEPSPDLDMGWFAAPSTRTMLVNSRVYGKYNGGEPVVASEQRFSEINRTGNYTPVKKIFVKVTDNSGAPVENAKVEFQLYNYAEFFPLAKTYTNLSGVTDFTTGMGTLMIWANKGNNFGYKVVSIKETDTALIAIGDGFNDGGYEEYLLIPPPEQKINTVSDKDEKENNARLQKEDEIRNAYMRTFKDSAWAVSFLAENGYKDLNAFKFITGSNGNWKEIISFLKNTPTAQKEYALKLLGVISEKDLHDAKENILRDHLDNAVENLKNANHIKSDVWEKYVLDGRIANEMMSAWRIPVKDKFLAGAKDGNAVPNPFFIKSWISGNIKI